jgi:hypothetical protein
MKQEKTQRFLRAVGEIDEGVLARYGAVEARLTTDRDRRARRLRFLAIAMAAAILLTAIPVGFLVARWGEETPPAHETVDTTSGDTAPDETYPPVSAFSPDAAASGAPLYIVGSENAGSSGPMEAPPAFEFCHTQLAVQAKAVECLPDTYCRMGTSREYRLILFETQEVIHGEDGLPDRFLYWLPAYLYVDMTAYDCLILALSHVSAGNFVVYNRTQGKAESFSLRVFGDYQDIPELGNIIAFTDGIFDESLWQTESWYYGYQFARYDLENNKGDLVVYRGDTLEKAKENIRKDIEEWKEHLGDRYSAPGLYTPTFDSPEAQAVLDYVKPFENGVFAESLNYASEHVFTRYLGGYVTNEQYRVHSQTGEVLESGVRFTEDDHMVDLSLPIGELAAAYAEEAPLPPHTDPEGKTLYSLWIRGAYVKTDEGVYGIIVTNWFYGVMVDDFTRHDYRDQAFLLFEPGSSEARSATREEIEALVCVNTEVNSWYYGFWYNGLLYEGEYGVPEEYYY